MGLVKTRRLAAMHPPSPRLWRTGKQQRAKTGMKPPKKSGAGRAVRGSLRRQGSRITVTPKFKGFFMIMSRNRMPT